MAAAITAHYRTRHHPTNLRELYEELYDEKVDTYTFGMCVVVSKQYEE